MLPTVSLVRTNGTLRVLVSTEELEFELFLQFRLTKTIRIRPFGFWIMITWRTCMECLGKLMVSYSEKYTV